MIFAAVAGRPESPADRKRSMTMALPGSVQQWRANLWSLRATPECAARGCLESKREEILLTTDPERGTNGLSQVIARMSNMWIERLHVFILGERSS